MTPSNEPNGKPLIYRIADKLGVFHLVAPVDHTHTYAEVPGLADDLSELWAGLNEKANQEDMTEALAGKQNVLTFDSTPTANSTNPVTSGGVAAAIKDARKVILNSNIPYVLSVAEKGVLYTSLFTNRTGAAVSLSECFDISGLPTAERNIFFNVAADSTEIANNETFGVRFLRTTSGVFVWYDGLFEF